MTHPLPDPMSRYREDGGPAFAPNGAPHPTDPTKAVYGMSLRDYFAGQAIAGMLANGQGPNSPWIDHPPSAATWAYQVADAMLAERSK